MIDKDQWQEIWAVLSKNKLRTILTAFGVFWGIFMLVIMLGAGKGLENGTKSMMSGWASNSMFMWTQGTSLAYGGFDKGRYFEMDNADVEAIKAYIPEVKYVAPRNQLGGWRGSNNVTRGTKTGAFDLYGDTPDYAKIQVTDLMMGRQINLKDLEEKRKIAVIGKIAYENLFEKGEDPLGKYIQCQGVNFKVVGVFKSFGADPERAESQERSIFVPFTAFQQAFNLGNKVGWMAITGKDNVDIDFLFQKVTGLLKRRHSISPNDQRAFGSWNLGSQFRKFSGLFLGIKMLSLVVGTLTLLAGAIGVSNIMLIIIKERTKEIGIRRALGATPWSIIKQILLEALFLTSLSGFLGMIAGVWALEGANSIMTRMDATSMYFRQPEAELQIVLLSLLILVIAGILAGIIPAKRAIDVKPVDALRAKG